MSDQVTSVDKDSSVQDPSNNDTDVIVTSDRRQDTESEDLATKVGSTDSIIVIDNKQDTNSKKLTKGVDDTTQERGFSASDEMSANPSAETSKKEESGATQLTENLQDPKNVPGPVEQETEAPPTTSAANQPTIEQRLKNLHPPVLDSSLFENYDRRSVPELCDLGREVTNDLSARGLSLSSVLKMAHSQRSQSGVDSEALFAYCNNLLEKLVEIKEEVEKRLEADGDAKHMTDKDLIAMLCDTTPVEVDPYKKQLKKQYDENLVKINALSLEMKEADWLQAVLDPCHVDKPQTSGIVTKGKQ